MKVPSLTAALVATTLLGSPAVAAARAREAQAAPQPRVASPAPAPVPAPATAPVAQPRSASPATARTPAPEGERALAPERRQAEPAGQPINVRLEVTVSDQRGASAPARKTLSLVLADRESGQVRSMATIPATNVARDTQITNLNFDLDATAWVLDGGKVRVTAALRLETPDRTSAEAVVTPRSVVQDRFTVVLDNGKTIAVAQSADPVSDRTVTVEVKAVVLR